jgi:phosphoserine phosphatase
LGRKGPATPSSFLPSWNEGSTRAAILDFVERVTDDGGPDFVAPDERVAVFDNDGTLWSEKPMPIELGFILVRLAEMAEADESLRQRQPWRAAYARDFDWLGEAMVKHYHGDDVDMKLLMGGVLHAYAGKTVDDYAAAAQTFLTEHEHPKLGRCYRDLGFAPMVELLRYLEANGFTNFIVSGGDRDFMRPVTHDIYGIPSERVVGSSAALRYEDDEHGGNLVYMTEMELFDDGPVKPVRIWTRIGRRPILAAGNSNGDVAMLRYAGGRDRPALRLLVNHDDAEREFLYTAGAEESHEHAAAHGWTVISMKDDWATVFADAPSR